MKAYIVRLNTDQDRPGEIVGFYTAEDMDGLYDLIDECCDVDCCEAMELGCGGIYWSAPTNYVVPLELSETAPGLPGAGTLTESWMASVHSGGNWEPIQPEALRYDNDA